jgi:hypothetical protein
MREGENDYFLHNVTERAVICIHSSIGCFSSDYEHTPNVHVHHNVPTITDSL